jgi:hypothetical protein
VYKGGLIPLARPVNKAVSPVVTSTGGSPTTFTAGTDYELRDGGIFIPTGSTMTNGQNILVDYTGLGFDTVQALTQSAQEYEMLFEGLNEARSGKPVVVQAFRVKLGAAQNLSLIGEEFAALDKTGSLSKYFTVKVAA